MSMIWLLIWTSKSCISRTTSEKHPQNLQKLIMCLLSRPVTPPSYSFESMHLGTNRSIHCSRIYRFHIEGRIHVLFNSMVDMHLQSPSYWLLRNENKQTLDVAIRWTPSNNAVQKILSPGSSQSMELGPTGHKEASN